MEISRRGLLIGAVASAATKAIASPLGQTTTPQAPRALRIAVITDVHLDNNRNCAANFARCLRKIDSLKDRPDFIVQGGDIIYDALTRDAANVGGQYDLAKNIIKRSTSLRVEHVIGNHDIWGWISPSAEIWKKDPRFGKAWWRKWSGQPLYRSFERSGWQFILLDSMMPNPQHGYIAKLDEMQFNWLQNELETVDSDKPICLVSHVPILSTSAMMFGDGDRRGKWDVPGWLMHIDARRIKDLLVKHPNVKAALSGHIHMHSRSDYNGVKHIGFGAVCGAWWRGSMQETPAGFGIVDFFTDGTLRHYYLTY